MSVQETTLEIRLDYLQHNVRQLKKHLKPGTRFLAVVKANSYGNSSVEVAKYLEKNNLADEFAVAFTSEGIELRQAGVTRPIFSIPPTTGGFRATCPVQPRPYPLFQKAHHSLYRLCSTKRTP